MGIFFDLVRNYGCKPYGVEINKKRKNYVETNLNINCELNIEKYEETKKDIKKFSFFRIHI